MIKANFILEKDTKNALRYQEVDENGTAWSTSDGAPIGTLYVRKSAFPPNNPPPAINVTVRFKGDDKDG